MSAELLKFKLNHYFNYNIITSGLAHSGKRNLDTKSEQIDIFTFYIFWKKEMIMIYSFW